MYNTVSASSLVEQLHATASFNNEVHVFNCIFLDKVVALGKGATRDASPTLDFSEQPRGCVETE